jgi:hypothetical protein
MIQKSNSEELPAADASEYVDEKPEEDLETTLAHMKHEHAQQLEQFQEKAAAEWSGITLTLSLSRCQRAHRRIFIIAKTLPCQ